MSGEPLACSLTSGELREREAELRALLGGDSLLSAAREGRDGQVLTLGLRPSPGLRGRLERAARLERACCPFLELAIEDAPDRIVLRISGPPEASAVIDGFEDLTARARRT